MPGPGFPTTNVVVSLVLNDLRREVRIIDIDGIVDHHCLNFLL